MNDGEMEIVRRRGMRTGYTTGACAAAAAAAATSALLSGAAVDSATIWLPAGREGTFAIARCEIGPDGVMCGVIKDAGDDPDVTHGAEIRATVSRCDAPGIELRGGEGVGRVTLPGLGLAIGGPAINPVPRRMILDEVRKAAGATLEQCGLVVEISVPRGEEIARKTLNARLGIVGGISILGTTGIVRPYSTASYRASVGQGIDVAAANGQSEVVLSTGGRSEQFAQRLIDLPEVCFVEMGEFTGFALKRAAQRRMRRATLAGMIGKFSKIAHGHFMTHVAGNRVDPAFLAGLAGRAGASPDLQQQMANANTARHVQELAQAHGLDRFFDLVAGATAASSNAHVHGALAVEAILFDFDGRVLGRATVPACEARR
ncbi:MAG TPA: cobalt-precorrin-5B (C(1))-methyltransferase [Dehalococcoidia bacterium]|nr:cobalt-precorrin-5B (C(1))-methyltransferase [Dehalococcoidia bacterium]